MNYVFTIRYQQLFIMTTKRSSSPSKKIQIKKQKLIGNREKTEEEDENFNDLSDQPLSFTKTSNKTSNSDLYLDTINRRLLDFDIPAVCSVTLKTTNVYVCLVCNKPFHGRSSTTPAYLHSINTNHHVFINLQSLKFYILPENYILSEETTRSLRDIQLQVQPKLDKDQINKLDVEPKESQDLNYNKYKPGYVPLTSNKISNNVVYQSLAHVGVYRDYLLTYKDDNNTPLSNQLSLLVRKLWSPYLFKSHVSPLMIENYIITNTKAPIDGNARDFLLWMLNSLYKENKAIIGDIFQGKLLSNEKSVRFLLLTFKLPHITLFKDGMKLDLPQLSLYDLIKEKKFNFKKFPKILILNIDRSNEMKFDAVEGSDLNLSIVKFNPDQLNVNGTGYKLVVNITIEDRVQILDKSRSKWYEIDGLNVKEVEKELLFMSNSYLQFWERI